MATRVILDTDIGTDIDDTWALAMLLNSPGLDLELVVTAHGDTVYRARVAAKMLAAAGRADIKVALGLPGDPLERFPQRGYIEGFDLADYPGAIAHDGIGALINAVMADPEPVVIVSIGPATNIAAALDAVPEIARRASFVGMQGAVRLGYKGSPTPVPEYNVVCDVAAFRTVLAAPWDITLTPLDSCGLVYLSDCDYACVRDSDTALAGIVMENYRVWARSIGAPEDLVDRRSTTLYDTVAITLASGGSDASAYLVMEDLDLHVMDDGLTVERAGGTRVHVATGWRDLDGFKQMLVERLTT